MKFTLRERGYMNTFEPEMNNKKYRSPGFTLVEVMVVLVILSVMAFFVAPEVMNWRPNMRLTDAAQDIYANMQNAKVEAIEKNENVAITFTVPGSYEIFVDDGATALVWDAGEETLSLDDDVDSPTYNTKTISLNTEVLFDGGTDFNGGAVTGFDPRGMPLSGNFGSVILKRSSDSNNNKWYRITLSASGGLNLEFKRNAAAAWE